MTYAAQLSRIEEIAQKLENPDLPIHDVLSLVREARALLKACMEELSKVEEDLQQETGDEA